MHSVIMRAITVAAAAAALGTPGVTGASVSRAATGDPRPVSASSRGALNLPAVPGAQLWVKRYNGVAGADDGGQSVAVSPDGATVFVTGESRGLRSGLDYATVAYSAVTGARLWVRRYNGPGNGYDSASAVVTSGSRVFVTGASEGAASGPDYATVAYSAATGARLWVRRFSGPGANSEDHAFSVAVSPAGDRVFVTGGSWTGVTSGPHYATIAYSAATGALRWVRRYNGPGIGWDVATSVAVSPGGREVFVTGESAGATSGEDYATIAYSAATGALRWVRRYNGPGNGYDHATSVAVSPAGGRVFVTGDSEGGASGDDYATVAYGAATGARLWVRRYNGPGKSWDVAWSVAVSPAGGRVFVTGDSQGGASGDDYATVAYGAATGARLWVRRYNGPGNTLDSAYSVAASPDGGKVFVTGESTGVSSGYDYAIVAYGAATGARLWVRRYNGPGNRSDSAASVAVGPGGSRVFVTGSSAGATSGTDFATLTYRG